MTIMKLKIGFTYDAKSDYKLKPTDPPDKYAEFDDDKTIDEIESALKSSNNEVIRIGNIKNLLKRIHNGERWDIIFNICEGIKGRNRESQVPLILELFEIPFTGSDALTMGLTLDKILAKKLIAYHRIRTPDFKYINSINELNKIKKWFSKKFPVIIKPSQEGTSKGISNDSLCDNFDKVKRQIKYILDRYKQTVLIEQFIPGYEFTVAIIGNNPPEILPPVQVSINNKIDLGTDFYTHRLVTTDEIKYICPAEIDTVLHKKLCDLALKSYLILGCKDVARIDIRVDYNMEPYFLECNPLPNLGKIDIFPIVARATNRTYNQIICYILESALKRYNLI